MVTTRPAVAAINSTTCTNWSDINGGTGVYQGLLERSRGDFWGWNASGNCNPTGSAVGRLYCYEP